MIPSVDQMIVDIVVGKGYTLKIEPSASIIGGVSIEVLNKGYILFGLHCADFESLLAEIWRTVHRSQFDSKTKRLKDD